MHGSTFVFFIFLIFTGTALLATLALYTRQSLLVSYIALGMLVGPYGFKLIQHTNLAKQIGDVGIIFLLFLLGLDLTPQDLFSSLRKTTIITLISAIIFASVGFLVAYLFGFKILECFLIGAAMIFSSTVIGLKLLPTTVLHHQHVGELMVSVLLLQDIIAILLMVVVHGASLTGSRAMDIGLTIITLPGLLLFAFTVQRYVIAKLFKRFGRIKEYIFLLAIGWCLGMAELSTLIGLSAEIGAFIAGVSIAEGPIAAYIAESLKPLRDFCLVVFFFTIGASIDLQSFTQVWLPTIILSGILLLLKPFVFNKLFSWTGETKVIAQEVGVRLGQNSEFSLLLGYLAVTAVPSLLSKNANLLIQASTILTFIISTYWVVLAYPTPVAFIDQLRRD